MRLHDKAIIVTGSTTGIGEAIARRCVAEGAKVLVHGRSEARARLIAEDIGSAASWHVDDLSDPDAAPRIVDAALKAWGRIDGLVNNAALSTRSTLEATTAEVFDHLIGINLRAPLLLIRAAVPELAKSKGAVLNIGSALAYCGLENLVPYSISKGGLMTMSRNLGDSLSSRGVRVNHMNIGWTLTPNEYDRVKIDDGLPEGWPENVPVSSAPFGRLMKPEEIAAAAVYWLSDESRLISGSVVDLEQYPLIGRVGSKQSD